MNGIELVNGRYRSVWNEPSNKGVRAMGIQDLKEKFVKFSTVFLSRGEGLSEYNGLVSWDFENVCACLGQGGCNSTGIVCTCTCAKLTKALKGARVPGRGEISNSWKENRLQRKSLEEGTFQVLRFQLRGWWTVFEKRLA